MDKQKHFFIIVPSAVMDSPIKGAAALANELSKTRKVTFITLKPGAEAYCLLSDSIERVSLGQFGGLVKLLQLRKLLRQAGGKNSVVAISSSFSADFINSWCSDLAITCCSVRGNLPVVYRMTYGYFGGWLAYFHLKRMRYFDFVISMTVAMSKQVQFYTGKRSPVIGNFIDEDSLDNYRREELPQGAYRFIFTGSMIEGKQPKLLLDALGELQNRGENVQLDFYGDGPLLNSLQEKAYSLPISNMVFFHGYVKEPYMELGQADVLVLPSLSEGISRSVLEALYLGVPCILRGIDGNSELISEGINGGIFNHNKDLADVMLRTVEWSRKRHSTSHSLLPPNYRQTFATKAYLNLLENNND